MKLQVSTVFNPSKKGKQFLTVEVLEGETPKVGEIIYTGPYSACKVDREALVKAKEEVADERP